MSRNGVYISLPGPGLINYLNFKKRAETESTSQFLSHQLSVSPYICQTKMRSRTISMKYDSRGLELEHAC